MRDARELFEKTMSNVRSLTARTEEVAEQVQELPSREEFAALETSVRALKRRHDELYAELDRTPDTPPRMLATGNTARHAGAITDY